MEVKDITELLPDLNPAQIIEVNTIENDLTQIKLKLHCRNPEEFKVWLTKFENHTCTKYSIRDTKPVSGIKLVFHQILHCHHNTGPRAAEIKVKSKNVNCPSKIVAKIRTVTTKYPRKEKNLNPDLPCTVTIIATHNHSAQSSISLKYRPVSNEVRDKLLDLFNNGHGVTSALEWIKMDIQLNDPNFEAALKDRKYCPDYNYTRYLLLHTNPKYNAAPVEKNDRELLRRRIDNYNIEVNDVCAMVAYCKSDYVICICTPLMKRVHKTVKNAGETVFVAAMTKVGKFACKIFHLFTHGPFGTLPLAIFIASNASLFLLNSAFNLLKQIVGATIFHNNINGPQVFLINDLTAMRLSIATSFSASKTLLSTFHVLRSVWNWIHKPINGIHSKNHSIYFQYFRDIVHAESIEKCHELFNDAIIKTNDNNTFTSHLEAYWKRKELWAVAYRNEMHNVNNFAEAGIRLLEDKIFSRLKAFNLVQTVDFIVTIYNRYFEKAILDVANNTNEQRLAVSPNIKIYEIAEKIESIREHVYSMTNNGNEKEDYFVYSDILLCTCMKIKSKRLCDHLHYSYYIDASLCKQRISEAIRSDLVFIATAPRNEGEITIHIPDFKLDGTLEFDSGYDSKSEIESNIGSENDDKIIFLNDDKTYTEIDGINLDCDDIDINQQTETNDANSQNKPNQMIEGESVNEKFLYKYVNEEVPYDVLTEELSHKDVVDILCENADNNYLAEGDSLIETIGKHLKNFLVKSPKDVCDSLKILAVNLTRLSSADEVAFACANFGADCASIKQNRNILSANHITISPRKLMAEERKRKRPKMDTMDTD